MKQLLILLMCLIGARSFARGVEDAASWQLQTDDTTLTVDKLDYFKTDYTPNVTSCQQTNRRSHYGEYHSIADAAYSGGKLMSDGIQIDLPGNFTSELIYLEEVH